MNSFWYSSSDSRAPPFSHRPIKRHSFSRYVNLATFFVFLIQSKSDHHICHQAAQLLTCRRIVVIDVDLDRNDVVAVLYLDIHCLRRVIRLVYSVYTAVLNLRGSWRIVLAAPQFFLSPPVLDPPSIFSLFPT